MIINFTHAYSELARLMRPRGSVARRALRSRLRDHLRAKRISRLLGR